METITEDPRPFALPFGSINMTERRIMASKFGVNWDAIEVDLSDIPKPEDPENATDDEKVAVAKAFTRIIGPNERFAMLFTAVKRQIPTATEAEISKRADSGEWVLSIGDDAEEVAGEGDPLPAPTATSDTTSSTTSS